MGGYSKKHVLHGQRYDKPPALPHRSERAEIDAALAEGLEIKSGWRAEEAEETFDVGGILMARPFKVVRIGPIRLFVRDMDVALRFYREELGFALTEETTYQGHRCAFLRVNTEHHSLALYPRALRSVLGLTESTSLMSFGLQVRTTGSFATRSRSSKRAGVTCGGWRRSSHPGSTTRPSPDTTATRWQLYYYMEQVGWDGKPRPASHGRRSKTRMGRDRAGAER